MSATLYAAEDAANPLDIVEQLVSANEWAFDRRTESEMAAEAPGQMVRLWAAFLLVAGDQRHALHLRLRPQGPGETSHRPL